MQSELKENKVKKLTGSQRKHLRGIAHGMRPVIFIGQKGVTDTLNRAIDDALTTHELIKIKFNEFKEKQQKKEISTRIEKDHTCENVGMIGHIVIFFRQNKDPEKRKITIPG